MTHLFRFDLFDRLSDAVAFKKNISGILRKKMGHEPTGPAPNLPKCDRPPAHTRHHNVAADESPSKALPHASKHDGLFVFNSNFLRANHGNRSASRLRYSFGRLCFGIEIDPLFVDVAIRRWQAFAGEKARRASDGMLFEAVLPEAEPVEEGS